MFVFLGTLDIVMVLKILISFVLQSCKLCDIFSVLKRKYRADRDDPIVDLETISRPFLLLEMNGAQFEHQCGRKVDTLEFIHLWPLLLSLGTPSILCFSIVVIFGNFKI